MKKRGLLLAALVAVLALLTVGCASTAGEETKTVVSNSYDNTGELVQKFTIANPTAIENGMEEKIQNRLLNGFENWNRGLEAWLEWGNILYTPDSMYNLHGARLTLGGYQNAMDVTLAVQDIQMGTFHNMIIVDDWCAIHYDANSTDLRTGEYSEYTVMEFVNFRDYGDPLGCRVVEGWASGKTANYHGMLYFATEEDRAAQEAFYESLVNYEIPETDVLAEKYPVAHPTRIDGEYGEEIRDLVLTLFESANSSKEDYIAWIGENTTEDFTWTDGVNTYDKAGYIEQVRSYEGVTERLYFNNLIVRDTWAGAFYNTRVTDRTTGEVAGDSDMQFLHFTPTSSGLKLSSIWYS